MKVDFWGNGVLGVWMGFMWLCVWSDGGIFVSMVMKVWFPIKRAIS
jgi:hypothetical protein